jgi:hypothetical protein
MFIIIVVLHHWNAILAATYADDDDDDHDDHDHDGDDDVEAVVGSSQ